MDNSFTYVSYPETGFFSHLVNDYLTNNPNIQTFYAYTPDEAGLAKAINERKNYPVNRQVLVDVLYRQYQNLEISAQTSVNIDLLGLDNTYTICTAHQPNLLTGYLYFIYKILHAIKLAEELNETYADKNFVPVYYMGSEDNDIEELGTFRFRGDKYVWDGDGQHGAVGRMDTKGLKKIFNELFKVFGPPGKNCDDLQNIITIAYLKHKTIGEATQYLVNALFGKYGLIVINPDDAQLKALFVPVIQDELLHQNAQPIIASQIEKLGQHYKIQAHPRLINLFYLSEQLRERIEQKGDEWVVLNSDKKWNQEELLLELNTHPERFSPNVMLRGLFQETILPNVVFIGGGAEVAYWLQLKPLFEHFKVFYPSIHLRQSVLWVPKAQSDLRKKLDFTIAEIFKPVLDLQKEYISKHTNNAWQIGDETGSLEAIMEQLKSKAERVDTTLGPAASAALTKMKKQLDALEKKMLRAEKRKLGTEMERIVRLKSVLFPNASLQERIENFMEYYLEYGPQFLDIIKEGILPLNPHFLVVEQY